MNSRPSSFKYVLEQDFRVCAVIILLDAALREEKGKMKCCSAWMRLSHALLEVLVCAPQLGVLTSPSASHPITPHFPLHHTHKHTHKDIMSPYNFTPLNQLPPYLKHHDAHVIHAEPALGLVAVEDKVPDIAVQRHTIHPALPIHGKYDT